MKLASETGRHRIKDDAWLSLVERCVRDAEAAGSNPVASTPKNPGKSRFSGVFLLPGKGDFVSYSRIYSRIFSKHRIRPGDGWKNNSCRLCSEEGIRHLFCHPCLLLFGGAGIDVHGCLDVPVADPGLDILDVNPLMDQDTDTGCPSSQVNT